MRVQCVMVLLVLLCSGCGKQEYGQCDAPDEHLKVLFKDKVSLHPFSHSFCIVCNTDISPDEYADWAMAMGAPQGPSDTAGVHPCLYVYSGPPGSDQVNSLASCQSLVCEGGATYNDMVGKNNSNINVSPLLNGDTERLEMTEEWVVRDDLSLDMSMPTQAPTPQDVDMLVQP